MVMMLMMIMITILMTVIGFTGKGKQIATPRFLLVQHAPTCTERESDWIGYLRMGVCRGDEVD